MVAYRLGPSLSVGEQALVRIPGFFVRGGSRRDCDPIRDNSRCVSFLATARQFLGNCIGVSI
jgi:hypothetical protein